MNRVLQWCQLFFRIIRLELVGSQGTSTKQETSQTEFEASKVLQLFPTFRFSPANFFPLCEFGIGDLEEPKLRSDFFQVWASLPRSRKQNSKSKSAKLTTFRFVRQVEKFGRKTLLKIFWNLSTLFKPTRVAIMTATTYQINLASD